MPPVVVGILLNSALYLSWCAYIGLARENKWAWALALLAMGLTYISYSLQYHGNRLATPAVVASIAAGVAAGAALLILG
mgnify:CR=1 FL=1